MNPIRSSTTPKKLLSREDLRVALGLVRADGTVRPCSYETVKRRLKQFPLRVADFGADGLTRLYDARAVALWVPAMANAEANANNGHGRILPIREIKRRAGKRDALQQKAA